MEKLTKLPEDVLEAVSSTRPSDEKQRKSKPTKPAAADSKVKDASLTEGTSEFQKIVIATSSDMEAFYPCL